MLYKYYPRVGLLKELEALKTRISSGRFYYSSGRERKDSMSDLAAEVRRRIKDNCSCIDDFSKEGGLGLIELLLLKRIVRRKLKPL